MLASHDLVRRKARGRRPLRIVHAEFTRGLYCRAYSQIIVRLPAPGGRPLKHTRHCCTFRSAFQPVSMRSVNESGQATLTNAPPFSVIETQGLFAFCCQRAAPQDA